MASGRRGSGQLAVAVCFALLVGSGCAIWRGSDARELSAPTADPNRLLVVTDQEAFELKPVKVYPDSVVGTVVRTWDTGGRGRADACDETRDSPDELAKRLRWFPGRDLRGELLELPMARVTCMRVYEPHTDRTIAAALVGGILGTGALAGIIVGIILLSVQSTAVVGRPLRVRGRTVKTQVVSGQAWSGALVMELQPVPPAVRPLLARIWTEEAQLEHTAVAAFSKLSLELMALGAPPDLVARANRAAVEEVHHARLCFAIASAYCGEPLAPAPLVGALTFEAPDLFRLARESLLDGCVGEGIAAITARLGAEQARDPAVAQVMRVQAEDEAGHAALSWAIVEWCLDSAGRNGPDLRHALVDALGEARMPTCHDLPEHGRVGRLLVEPEFDALIADARRRLAASGKDAPRAPEHHARAAG